MSTDLDLLAQYSLTRSQEAFRAIVARHGPMVHRVGMRILRDRHAADDVVQLAFIQLSQKPESAYPKVAGWLHRVAHNTAMDLLRSRVSRARREEAKVRAMVETRPDGGGELREEIDAALVRLPEALREAVILHYLEGHSYEEAARLSGCTEEAVRKRSQRGLRELRVVLAGRGVICGLAGLSAFFASESAASAAVPASVVWELGRAGAAVPKGPVAEAARAATQGAVGAKLAVAVAAVLAGTMVVHAVDTGDVRGWLGLGQATPIAIAIPTAHPGFIALSLKEAATASSSRPVFRHQARGTDVFVLPSWGEVTTLGIPFWVEDPRDGAVRNLIALYGPVGDYSRRWPKRASVGCDLPARAVHLLSGVGARGYPYLTDKTVSMIVRLRYAGGGVEDHPLLNGVHFADYRYYPKAEVPGSKQALRLKHGHQMRHLAITPGRPSPIEQIEFIKGDDTTAPVVLAVTIETGG